MCPEHARGHGPSCGAQVRCNRCTCSGQAIFPTDEGLLGCNPVLGEEPLHPLCCGAPESWGTLRQGKDGGGLPWPVPL